MPAPQRKPKQMVSIANDAIFANDAEIPVKPVIVRAPGQTNGDSLERFTEIIMFAVAMLTIWTGLIGIAFAEGVGDDFVCRRVDFIRCCPLHGGVASQKE